MAEIRPTSGVTPEEVDDVSRDARDWLVGGILFILAVLGCGWLMAAGFQENNWILAPLLNCAILCGLPFRPRNGVVAFGRMLALVLIVGLIAHVFYDELWAPIPLEQRVWVLGGLMALNLTALAVFMGQGWREWRAQKAAGVQE